MRREEKLAAKFDESATLFDLLIRLFSLEAL